MLAVFTSHAAAAACKLAFASWQGTMNPEAQIGLAEQLDGGLVSYPLCANHMPQNVWREITGSSIGTHVSRLGFEDAPDHILSFNCFQNGCDVTACKHGEDEIINDIGVFQRLMEAAVHEIYMGFTSFQDTTSDLQQFPNFA